MFCYQQNVWDLENTDESKEKIWKIAQERYKGWRTTFSATYSAHDSYDARIKHKPEDLDIVECHYLIMYFGSNKFKVRHLFLIFKTHALVIFFIPKCYLLFTLCRRLTPRTL